LICSTVFLRSAVDAATVDPGIRTSDTIVVDIANEDRRAAMLEAVTREPFVTSMAATWPDVLARPRAAFAAGTNGKSTVAYKFVSPEYFEVLGVEIVRGRGFTPAERSAASAVAVVAESVARQLWPDRDAVGQILQLEPDPNSDSRRADEPPLSSRSLVVVGVARDVAGFRFAENKPAGVYVPISGEAAKTSLTVRVVGDPEVARRALLERLTVVDPNIGMVFTLKTAAGMETYFLRIAFWITLVLGGLALVLTLSGLFSVLSYLVEQRTGEIGVRMALGATDRRIGMLVLLQSARPVGLGVLAGASLAAALGGVLLTTPAAEQIAKIVRLFDPGAYAASALSIVAACAFAALIPAVRAGRVDPVATLRRE
jgi:hypothetical protein